MPHYFLTMSDAYGALLASVGGEFEDDTAALGFRRA